MRPSQLLRELHEANQRIAKQLEARDLRIARDVAMTLADVRELRWLEKDYDEYIEEMSLGGKTYKPK